MHLIQTRMMDWAESCRLIKKGLRSRKISIIQPAKCQFHPPEHKQGYTPLTANAAKCRNKSDHLLVQKPLKPVSALSWEEVWKYSMYQLCLQHFGTKATPVEWNSKHDSWSQTFSAYFQFTSFFLTPWTHKSPSNTDPGMRWYFNPRN